MCEAKQKRLVIDHGFGFTTHLTVTNPARTNPVRQDTNRMEAIVKHIKAKRGDNRPQNQI